MEGNRFCTRCGAELMEGASFCKECGSPVGGYANPYQTGGYRVKKGPSFAFVILIYGIMAVVIGLVDALSAIGLTEEAYQEMVDTVSNTAGMDMSGYFPAWSPNMAVLMPLSMVFLAISGALAVYCYFRCRKADDWKTCVILCAASSIACLGMCCFTFYASIGIILFVFGLVFTALLYASRNTFNA